MLEQADAQQARKKNRSMLLVGMTGSGKTQIAKRLLRLAPRAIVLDRQMEYTDGAIFEDWREATDFYVENIDKDWHIIYRGSPDETVAWMDLAFESQKNIPHLPPLAFFIDETSYYSTTHNIDGALDQIYTKGRHARISMVASVQRLTQVHPIIRDNSHVWVALKMKSFPAPLKERFTPEELDTIAELEPVTPFVSPKYGQHYITDVGDVAIFNEWAAILSPDAPDISET